MLWAGVFAFAIQIYADFSAYTDIARGVAKWYGFDLIRNFERPYLATGPGRFLAALEHLAVDLVPRLRLHPAWRLAARPWRRAANILITFLVSGLWHGASWNYVLWGAYHGVLLVVARAAGQPCPPKRAARSRGLVAPAADRRRCSC